MTAGVTFLISLWTSLTEMQQKGGWPWAEAVSISFNCYVLDSVCLFLVQATINSSNFELLDYGLWMVEKLGISKDNILPTLVQHYCWDQTIFFPPILLSSRHNYIMRALGRYFNYFKVRCIKCRCLAGFLQIISTMRRRTAEDMKWKKELARKCFLVKEQHWGMVSVKESVVSTSSSCPCGGSWSNSVI